MSAVADDRHQGVVVIGVGNPFRRDDGIGSAVLDELRAEGGAGIEWCELDGEPARLVEAWRGASLAVVVDALSSGGAPGTVCRFEVGIDALPTGSGAASSHSIGLAEAVELGQAVDQLPGRLVVFGVEAADLGAGPGLSKAVAASVGTVVTAVRREIGLEPMPTGDRADRPWAGARER